VKRINLKYCLLALSLTTIVSMSSCSTGNDDADNASAKITDDNTAKLLLTLNTNSASRADVDATIAGTTEESAYNTLTVFFTNTSDQIVKTVKLSNVASASTVMVPLVGLDSQTTYHVYIAANMDQSITLSGNINDAFATLSNISSVASANNFLMTGQVTMNGGTAVTFIDEEVTHASVILDRVVAKVLVTGAATLNSADNNYYIDDVNGAGAFINLNDITFSLMTANTSYYYFQQKNASNVVTDKNYDMDTYLSSTDQFMNPTTTMAAQLFDATKINNNDPAYISHSIYCLENTTNQSASYSTWGTALQLTNAQKVATYVHVMLKGATPKVIDGTTYTTAAAAKAALTDGTFYTCLKAPTAADRIRCFSTREKAYAAFPSYVSSVNDESIKAHSVSDTYNFYTFVNGKTFAASGSSVLRDNYYIITITQISTPYTDKVMEINTKVTGWTLKGTTTQDVDTSGTTK
jgi:hypothetical protein